VAYIDEVKGSLSRHRNNVMTARTVTTSQCYLAVFAAISHMAVTLVCRSSKHDLKGQCNEMDIFCECLNILISTFCVCGDGFQVLSKAFHYNC
jgi:hypothetical protein